MVKTISLLKVNKQNQTEIQTQWDTYLIFNSIFFKDDFAIKLFE
jgi:hypothetical protein